jgi:cytochrome P450
VPRLEKEERASHIPYYEGKRKCMGWALGELFIKLSVGNMLKMFELENRQDGEIKMEITVSYAAVDAKIAIKLK